MRKALIYLTLLLSFSLSYAQEADSLANGGSAAFPKGRLIEVTGAFLQPVQERDSILIADQLYYGFELKQVREGTLFALPEWKNDERGGVQAISPWVLDTLKATKSKNGTPRLLDIRGRLLITSFDEGNFQLPQIMVGRMSEDGVIDTLLFDPLRLEVKTMPVDTATFVPHDIKGQMRYPVTFREVIPWVGGACLLAAVIALAISLIMKYARRNDPACMKKEPAHIVALRELDKYRGNKLWVPEKQKQFYSGVTDVLREYMSARYGVSAMEMTTAEIFREMKNTDAPELILKDVRELFERADFVKFAKFVASDDDNASVLPLAVRFVTETYQAELENEEHADVEGVEKSEDGGNE